jgi:hypothetical protein
MSLTVTLLLALPSLSEWLDVARRRGRLVTMGLGPLITGFENANLRVIVHPSDRIKEGVSVSARQLN